MSAAQLNTTFNDYGNAGGHWTGGDSTASVPLPDGRTAWLFSDTFLGTVNADGSRPTGTPLVNNTIVVQSGTSLVDTLHGGTSTAPQALVKPSQTDEYFWVADGTVENGALKVLYNRYRRSGTGNLDFEITGTSLATFALPGLTLTGVTDLPLSNTVAWGSAILEDGAYTYVYGSESSDGLRFAKIARVPSGGLGGAWQFWTGFGWSATESSAARVLSGVGTAYGVQKVGNEYVLLTHENNLIFDAQYLTYTAPSPTGPFNTPQYVFTAPEQVPGEPIVSYDARLHPHLAPTGKLLVSYNVNTLDDARTYADASIYRPRFVEVTWPRPTPDPATLPGRPTGLTVDIDSLGVATLSWQPVAGATGYRVYQRDTTAGQTHFARLASTVTGTSAKLDRLMSEHVYEFKVTAVGAAGEGGFSDTVSATPTVSAPPAPTAVTATADDQGSITLSWAPVPTAWNYQVYRRDVTAGETERSFVTRLGGTVTSHTMQWLEPGHVYEFHVVASHGGGDSPASATATATARYAPPPAPTGLTATANPDGSIGVSWTGLDTSVFYWVYQRDVTAGETEFTKLDVPTEATSMTAAFLTHAHRYEFKVAASNRGGEGAASAPASATSAYPKPAPPSGLTATVGDGEVVLNWSASSTPNVWYLVYQRDVTAGESAFTQLPLPITECCTVKAAYLMNGHRYEFKVTTTSQGGESTATNLVQATPQMPLPGQVTGLTATAQSNGTIKLAWTAPGDNLWFDIYQRDVTAGQAFSKLPLPVTTCCTFTADVLTHDHIYEFKVTATNAAGAGPQSAAAQATAHYDPPAAPTNLRGESAGDGTIHLDWDPPAAGSFYYWVYFRDVTAGQATFTKGQFPTNRTEVDLAYLAYGHVYEYKVAASNAGGEGPTSTTVRVTATGGLPAAPTGLTASAGDGEARLSWTASSTSGVTYDVYQRNASAGQSWQKLPLPVSGTSMTASYLANGSTYEFKVTASNWAGASGASNVASARPMPPLPAAPSGLTANPGDGQATLRWTASPSSNVNYMIEMRPVGGVWDQLPIGVSCCSYTVKLLRNGTTYEFRVRAHNISGDSAATGVASARPMPPFPQPASGLTATPGDGQATLKWAASSTAGVSYRIEMRARGGNWQALPFAVPCCSYTVKLLLNGTTYDFRVLATNLTGTAAATNTASARPMPPMPSEPDGIVVDPEHSWAVMDTWVSLSWAPNKTRGVWYSVHLRNVSTGSSWFEVYRRNAPDSTYETLYNLPGGTYEFKIRAFNITGSVESGPLRAEVKKRKPDLYHSFTAATTTSRDAWSSARASQSVWSEYYFDWSADGCSFKLGDHRADYIVIYDNDFFRRPCERHDFGYRNHGWWGTKDYIDWAFAYDMQKKCQADAAFKLQCEHDASIYFAGVQLLGGSAWNGL
ncbi:phospholipase A2 [Micromonospora purpureochromogenes]|nr:phospholipase A2 [Micromonospora purpureochromogenes]